MSCCTAVVVLSLTQFDQESLTFDSVLKGDLEKSLKFPKKSLKIGFLVIPSDKHLKKYEKGGFWKGLYKYVWHGRVTV